MYYTTICKSQLWIKLENGYKLKKQHIWLELKTFYKIALFLSEIWKAPTKNQFITTKIYVLLVDQGIVKNIPSQRNILAITWKISWAYTWFMPSNETKQLAGKQRSNGCLRFCENSFTYVDWSLRQSELGLWRQWFCYVF